MPRNRPDVFEFKDLVTTYTVISPGTGETVLDARELPGEAHVGLRLATQLANENTGGSCWVEVVGPRPQEDDGLIF